MTTLNLHQTAARPTVRPLFGPALLLLAANVRVVAAYAARSGPAFDMEELEYLRIASNLAAGEGYVGLYGGPQTVHSPLYPLVTRLVLFAVPDVQKAGVLVSMLGGALLVLLVYLLALHLFDKRTAVCAAALVTFSPYLIALSMQATSESLFLAALCGAILLTLYALERRRLPLTAAAGAATGLCYLARPTGLLLLPLTALFLILLSRPWLGARRVPASHLAVLLAGAAVVMSPELLFLRRQLGSFVLDGKSAGIQQMAAAIYDGADYREAGLGVSADLQRVGFEIDHTQVARELQQRRAPDLAGRARWMLTVLRHLLPNSRPLIRQALNNSLPLVLVLAALGLPAAVQARGRRSGLLYVALVAAGLLLVQLTVPWFWQRYLAPFVLFILLAAAVGWGWLSDRLARRCESATWSAFWLRQGTAVFAALLVSLLGLLFSGPARLRSANTCFLAEQETARWLTAQRLPSAPHVAATSLTTAYYSGGTAQRLPVADEATALRLLTSRGTTHIALARGNCDKVDYACAWLDAGIADPQARLLRRETVDGCDVALFAWTPHLPVAGTAVTP